MWTSVERRTPRRGESFERRHSQFVHDLLVQNIRLLEMTHPAQGRGICYLSSVKQVWSKCEARVKQRWSKGEAKVKQGWSKGEATNHWKYHINPCKKWIFLIPQQRRSKSGGQKSLTGISDTPANEKQVWSKCEARVKQRWSKGEAKVKQGGSKGEATIHWKYIIKPCKK